jgi:hypothetical protein
MRALLKPFLYPALAVIGYFAGTRFPWDSLKAQRDSANRGDFASSSNEAAPAKGDGIRRDPRTGASFAESRERLRDLAQQARNVGTAAYLIGVERFGSAQLEIERIFSLATKEEMLAYFAVEDLSKTETVLLSAAYARLATLSPTEAVAIWSDHFRRTGKGPGVDGLVRGWADQDAAAAEQWIDQLSDAKIRDGALIALLDSVVESSPDLVERRIMEVKDVFHSIHLVSRLGWELDMAKFVPLADRFLSERHGEREYQDQLVYLLEVWGERDGASMMAWLTSQPPGKFQDHVITRVAQARAKADPAAFAREIGPSLAGNKSVAAMAGEAWLTWLEKGDDDEGAMIWFATHGKHIPFEKVGHWRSGTLTAEKAGRILPLLSELPDSEQRTQLTRSILGILSHTDPKSALVYSQDLLPPGQESDDLIANTLSQLARNGDPAGALVWALENLKAGRGKNDAVRFVMTAWAEVSPLAAVQQAGSLPEDLREKAYDGIAYRWAEKAPDQLVKFLSEAPANESTGSLARNGFWSLGFHKGGEPYLAAALALPNEAMRTKAIGGLFGGWARANLETSGAALAQLETGPSRDAAISEFVSQAASTDREAALTWSLDITEPKKRREVTMQQSRYWLNADREKAVKWIEANETLPEEWRVELLKPKG